MKIERRKVDELIFDPANARRHDQRNLEAIKGSLARFGQQKPIVVDGNNVVRAGNGTLEAARQLGWEEIDAVRSDLQGAEMTAFAIADNRTAELAEWNQEVLAATLQSLDDAEVPVADLGFDLSTMRAILSQPQQDLEDLGDLGELAAGVDLVPSPNQFRGDGEGGEIRSIILPFSVEQHEKVTRYFVRLREETGTQTNAAALLKKAEDWEEQA